MPSYQESIRSPIFKTCQLISELPCLIASERESISPVSGLKLEVCTLSSVIEEWLLLQEQGISTPFQQLDWVSFWLNSYTGKYKIHPFMVVVRNEQRIEMLLPLMLEHSMSASRLLWLGHKGNDYNAPLFADQVAFNTSSKDAQTILKQVADFINADCVYIIKQPAELAGRTNPFSQINARPFTSQTYALDLSAGWPAVYTQARSSRTRQRERNKLNRLRDGETVQLRCIRDATESKELLELAMAWKSEQLDRTGVRNPFSSLQLRKQLIQLATKSDKSFCRLYVMEREGIPLAVTLGLVQSGVFNYYFSSYNPDVSSSTSPGRIMMLKLVQLAARAKLKFFDFSLGDEPYKLELCRQGLPMTVSGFATTAKGHVRLNISWLRLRLKHYVKNSTYMMGLVRGVNQLQKLYRPKKLA